MQRLSLAAGESQGAPFSVEGLLLPSAQAKLASRSKGVIEEIKREGDAVKAGEVVMLLESDMERLQQDQQRHVLDLRTFERAASDELSQKSVISKTEVEENVSTTRSPKFNWSKPVVCSKCARSWPPSTV